MSVLFDGDSGEVISGVDVGDIPASLRFRGAASAYLSRTITTDATSTYFAVVKRGRLGVISPIFDTNIRFNANDTLTAFGLTTTAVFRDPTSWLFIHVSNGGLYVNGVSYGVVTTSAITNPRIGFDGTNYFDGYMARVGVVAGASSSYTNFGYLNTEINEWVSKTQSQVKAVVDAGGANSFMLDFDDATSLTTLGYDKSAKGNNWTLNNISLTAGATYDHMLDAPGNSYATWNQIDVGTGVSVFTEANLVAGASSSFPYARATVSLGNSVKWYAEFKASAVSGGYPLLGVKALSNIMTDGASTSLGDKSGEIGLSFSTGNLRVNGALTVGWTAALTSSDIVMVAYDAASGKLWFGKNGSWLVSGDPVAGINQAGTISASDVAFAAQNWESTTTMTANFGQRPFTYTPPTGYKALCQANLPGIDPATLLDPTDHHIDITVTKSSDTNFTLPWNASTYDTFFEIKRRDAAGDWYQIDGLRGYDKILKSNSTAAETTAANVIGVSGTTCTLKSALADGTYVISATKAGLASDRQTNTDGTITSTVSRNVDSGFAIVTYTGTGANATVGHGLSVAPKLIIVKGRNDVAANNWTVWHQSLANTEYLLLNTTGAKVTLASMWNSTSPTLTTISLGSYDWVNKNTYNFVAYCYADSAIQKSFSYTGNGSADGAYADLGFKIGRTLLKCSSTTGNWTVLDSARSPDNVVNEVLYENLNNIEATSDLADFTSRGIKFRIATDPNSAQTFIGHAWAVTTGKYSNAR